MVQFEILLEKFIGDVLTQDELVTFLLHAKEPANQQVVKDALAQRFDAAVFEDLSEGADLEMLFREMLLRANRGDGERGQVHDPEEAAGEEGLVVRIRPVRRWKRISAAAAVLVVLGAGGWFWRQHRVLDKQGREQAAIMLDKDIKPGGDKAVLTLADGSKIILDSAAGGKLAQQGAATITKTGKGQLTYIPLKENSGQVLYNTLITPRGGQYVLLLPDGSKVWLDAASSIRYPTAFTGGTRRVEVSGQAYFEVVHKSDQPFEVSVGGLEIRDIGTHFNVNAYADEPLSQITLTEGAIAVAKHNAKLVLRPGEQAQSEGGELRLNKDVDLDAVMAWKNGEFQLGHAGFGALMRQVSRWYDVDIVYEGREPDKKFWGTVKRNVSLSRLLEVLQDDGIEVRLEGKKIIIK